MARWVPDKERDVTFDFRSCSQAVKYLSWMAELRAVSGLRVQESSRLQVWRLIFQDKETWEWEQIDKCLRSITEAFHFHCREYRDTVDAL